jgi:hypothetical protein
VSKDDVLSSYTYDAVMAIVREHSGASTGWLLDRQIGGLGRRA